MSISHRRLLWGLDFETACELDLKEVGLDRYLQHPSFRVLCAAIDTGGVLRKFDFVREQGDLTYFKELVRANHLDIAAHNAPFEQLVLHHMGISTEHIHFIDTAVIARCMGASSRLERAAPQLTNKNKLAEGKALIDLFSKPRVSDGKFLVDEHESWPENIEDLWKTFLYYCKIDAEASRGLASKYQDLVPISEIRFAQLTHEMNQAGWKVDLPLVEEMRKRYHKNLEMLLEEFRARFDPDGELNFNSPKQLIAYCAARGVRIKSLDKTHLPKVLDAVEARLNTARQANRFSRTSQDLYEVREMLLTKQALGSPTLTKLDTILKHVGPDGRLRNQYLHAGAGTTHRTSARSVQMQNLKRLGDKPDDVEELHLQPPNEVFWDNELLSRNIRQVFTAPSRASRLIVADFSQIEARALPWLADQEWTLDAFRQGRELYKVMASRMFGVPYERITKESMERRAGKVGVLACGYGAGPKAVRKFAEKMGIDFTLQQATDIVNDWRSANEDIVQLWHNLDAALREAVESDTTSRLDLRHDTTLWFEPIESPQSLVKQLPNARSIRMLLTSAGLSKFSRVFQGVHMVGSDMCYMKPDESQGSRLWKETWFKDGVSGRYKLYGGKLAGILTQSLGREIFFDSIANLAHRLRTYDNVQMVGQFHDEVVVEWTNPMIPHAGRATLAHAVEQIQQAMSYTTYADFPLDVSIASDYRYIK